MPGTAPAQHADEKDLELYLKDQLGAGAMAAMEAHLASCQACVSRLAEQDQCLWYLAELSAGDGPHEGEKRQYPRVATDEPATIQVLNPFAGETWDVRIVDVSKGGLRTYTPKPLEPGSLIKVKMQFSVACGDVRYCVPGDNGFYAGVRLHDYFAR
jgi:hypothetical protein